MSGNLTIQNDTKAVYSVSVGAVPMPGGALFGSTAPFRIAPGAAESWQRGLGDITISIYNAQGVQVATKTWHAPSPSGTVRLNLSQLLR